MKKHFSKIRGFTLIELLITIAIIAILTGIVMSSFGPSKSKARDAKRISDIGGIQLALELYFDRCKQYPNTVPLVTTANNGTGGTNGTCTSGITLGDFISTIPTSASPNDYVYKVSSTYNDYVLKVQLEKYNEILKDDIDGNPISGMGASDCGGAGNGDSTNELIYCIGPR